MKNKLIKIKYIMGKLNNKLKIIDKNVSELKNGFK